MLWLIETPTIFTAQYCYWRVIIKLPGIDISVKIQTTDTKRYQTSLHCTKYLLLILSSQVDNVTALTAHGTGFQSVIQGRSADTSQIRPNACSWLYAHLSTIYAHAYHQYENTMTYSLWLTQSYEYWFFHCVLKFALSDLFTNSSLSEWYYIVTLRTNISQWIKDFHSLRTSCVCVLHFINHVICLFGAALCVYVCQHL